MAQKTTKAAPRLRTPDAQSPKKAGIAREEPMVATPNSESDRAWKLARLAAILASNLDSQAGPPHGLKLNPRLSTREDAFLAAALHRADRLLRLAEGTAGEICAYQIFEEGERQTEGQIVERFRHWNWNGLKSKQPVMDLMQSIRDRFEAELNAEQERYDKIVGLGVRELLDDITKSIRDRFTKHFEQPVEDFESPLKEIIASLTTTIGEKLYEHFGTGDSTEHFFAFHDARWFFHWCFPEPSDAQRAERLYRPHEIFRRCAARGWSVDNLKRARDGLTSTLIPFPPDDLRLEVFTLFNKHTEGIISEGSSARSKDATEAKPNPPAGD